MFNCGVATTVFPELLPPSHIYISGNPYINSKVETAGFDAKKHFYKVIDVWDFGWDWRIGTVPPREINRAALRCYLKYPGKRFIIHYMQPHAPYLSAKFRLIGYYKSDLKTVPCCPALQAIEKLIGA